MVGLSQSDMLSSDDESSYELIDSPLSSREAPSSADNTSPFVSDSSFLTSILQQLPQTTIVHAGASEVGAATSSLQKQGNHSESEDLLTSLDVHTNDPSALQSSVECARSETLVIRKGVKGTVCWFNVKRGYGFIKCDDTKKDFFVHCTYIANNNPNKRAPSLGEGEEVLFDVVYTGGKCLQAVNVTGPEGASVRGSKYAIDINKKSRRRRGVRSSRQEGILASEQPQQPDAPEEAALEEGQCLRGQTERSMQLIASPSRAMVYSLLSYVPFLIIFCFFVYKPLCLPILFIAIAVVLVNETFETDDKKAGTITVEKDGVDYAVDNAPNDTVDDVIRCFQKLPRWSYGRIDFRIDEIDQDDAKESNTPVENHDH